MKKILAILFTITLSACVTNPKEPVLKIGTTYQNTFPTGYGGINVPLETGKWVLIGSSKLENNNNIAIATNVLIQTEGDVISKAIIIKSPLSYEKNGYNISNWCNAKNVHYLKKRAAFQGGDQDCWGVNHYWMTFRYNKIFAFKHAQEYVRDNRLNLPVATIGARYFRANNYKFLDVTYYFNPELDGFSPPSQARWATSDWHPERMSSDTKKIAYIEKIKQWGEMWYPKVQTGFND